MKKIVKFVSIAVWVAISTNAFSQESVMLKYGMKEGLSFTQEMEIHQNTVQSMMGQEIKVVGEIKAINAYKVEDLSADGNATVLMTVKEISIRTSAMGRDTSMSYKDVKDAVRLIITPEGKTLSSAKIDSSKASAVINQMEPGKFRALPGKVVKIGESWDESYAEVKNSAPGTPFGLNMAVENKYTLVGKEVRDGKEYYRISNSGTLGITGKGSQMGMEMFVEGNAKVEGYSLFDPVKQMIIYTEDDTEMELSVAISGPQNMTIPMTQSIKSVTRIK